ncbi:hypothetical protein KZX29_00135 [Moraxella osloensis]|uniref:hypothetical protein n=1 Tax=Faucicola osloensis TaxID=34062 RepID=UPI0020061A17|nr:hypothetical protein [Moraxella osloensis]MCK6157215.1 hypothetical protein [Moraxella osloensis]
MKSDILRKRFGQSRLLNLEALEWLESTMHAKTVRFDIGKGGGTPEVTWEDRCAAVAMIKSKPARALASLLIWGYDQDQFDIIAHHLAGKMAAQCRADKKAMPKGCPYSIDEMAGKMAQMVLYFTLYDLWELYTVQGRLVFSGINMPDKTYSNQMLPYQRLMLDIIKDLAGTVDDDVQKYKSQIKIE